VEPVTGQVFVIVQPVLGLVDQKFSAKPGKSQIVEGKMTCYSHSVKHPAPEVNGTAQNRPEAGQEKVANELTFARLQIKKSAPYF
jgi:nicotinamide mononucleotide (NMN) deamidase PncC